MTQPNSTAQLFDVVRQSLVPLRDHEAIDALREIEHRLNGSSCRVCGERPAAAESMVTTHMRRVVAVARYTPTEVAPDQSTGDWHAFGFSSYEQAEDWAANSNQACWYPEAMILVVEAPWREGGTEMAEHPEVVSVELYVDGAGEYRWHALAANHRIVADSGEGYVHHKDCVDAAKSIFPYLPEEAFVNLT